MEYEIVKCYDTITKSYVTVEVTKEVGQFLKRSYWREDMQERRFNKRRVSLDDAIGYNSAYLSQVSDLTDILIQLEREDVVKKAISKLDEREQIIVQNVYYKKRTLSDTAKLVGVSSSHMSRLVKKLLIKLQTIITKDI